MTKTIRWGAAGLLGTLGARIESGPVDAPTTLLARNTADVKASPLDGRTYSYTFAVQNDWGPDARIRWDNGVEEWYEALYPAANMLRVNDQRAEPASGGGAFAVTVAVTNVAGGAAIVGASVRMTDASGSYEAATDASGEAAFNLDASTYTLGVFKEGSSTPPPTNATIPPESPSPFDGGPRKHFRYLFGPADTFCGRRGIAAASRAGRSDTMGLALSVRDVAGHRVWRPEPVVRLVPPLEAPRLRRPPAPIVVRDVAREPARPQAGRVDEEDAERWDGMA